MASGLKSKDFFNKYFDPKLAFNTYINPESDFFMDVMKFPLTQLLKVFTSDVVKGETLISIDYAQNIQHLLPACSAFKEIIVADYIDASRQELEKWLKKDSGALDWTEHVKYFSELEGKRDNWTAKEDELRRKIKQVVKCDITESCPLAPLDLPPVDCVLTSYYLEAFCLDQESYCSALKNMSTLLKPGGYLVMVTFFGATFIMYGKLKFPLLCTDEAFVRKSLSDTGYAMVEMQVKPRVVKGLYEFTDSTGVLFLVARKEMDAQKHI